MKTAIKIVLTLTFSLTLTGCDRYWQETLDGVWPHADTDDVLAETEEEVPDSWPVDDLTAGEGN
jgi:hypothetical protein